MKLPDFRKPKRLALDDYPNPPAPSEPTVAIIVPVFNEARHLERVFAELIDQDYKMVEVIIFVDGGSKDGTLELLTNLQREDSRITVMGNPGQLPAVGINLALAKVNTDVVLRLDAHAHYARDVVRQCVTELLATGAGGVGALARPFPGTTLMAQAIAAAHTNPLGLGSAKFRKAVAEGWVDTVWNGCYWTHVLRRVGRLREDMPRAEDNDFNERLRRLGYGLYLSPRINAQYEVRQSISELWKQYFANGRATILAFPKNPRAFTCRHIVPMAFFIAFLFSIALGLYFPDLLIVAAIIIVLYMLAIAAAVAISYLRRPGSYLLYLPLTLATIHLSHGVGAFCGCTQMFLHRLGLTVCRKESSP